MKNINLSFVVTSLFSALRGYYMPRVSYTLHSERETWRQRERNQRQINLAAPFSYTVAMAGPRQSITFSGDSQTAGDFILACRYDIWSRLGRRYGSQISPSGEFLLREEEAKIWGCKIGSRLVNKRGRFIIAEGILWLLKGKGWWRGVL